VAMELSTFAVSLVVSNSFCSELVPASTALRKKTEKDYFFKEKYKRLTYNILSSAASSSIVTPPPSSPFCSELLPTSTALRKKTEKDYCF